MRLSAGADLRPYEIVAPLGWQKAPAVTAAAIARCAALANPYA
jgi:hypothetical protein